MEIVNRVSRMAAIADKSLVTDVKIGLVPTAGAIHPGNLALIRTARRMADLAIVSIFVNPHEFSSDDEYRQYPRDITADVDLLRLENVDYVFIPQEEEMYSSGFATWVEVRREGSELGLPPFLCRGMPTGAIKLLHITKPAYVFYGEQDAVQAAVLRKMVRDLNVSTDVVITEAGREASGLALSGRNHLLTDSQRAVALVFHRSLQAARDAIAGGETNARKIRAEMIRVLAEQPLVAPEYAVVLDPELLEPAARIQGTVIIGVGGRLGSTFLSDAAIVEKKPTAAGD